MTPYCKPYFSFANSARFKPIWSKIACIGESQEASEDRRIKAKILRPKKSQNFKIILEKSFFMKSCIFANKPGASYSELQ